VGKVAPLPAEALETSPNAIYAPYVVIMVTSHCGTGFIAEKESIVATYDIDDVCDRLDSIEEAIKQAGSGGGSWWNFALGVFVAAIIIPEIISTVWHSKWRYAFQYGVPYSRVAKTEKPHDCAFMKAPIGDKECHYDIQVTYVRTSTDVRTGKPIVSYDDGKNWSWDDESNPTKPSVDVSWVRTEE
jgi:hypothetical protein